MWFLYVLGWVALVIQIVFFTIGLAAGLYYVAELVEEYTVTSKKIITWITLVVLAVYFLFLVLEDFSYNMIICGIISQFAHLSILQNFPYVDVLSPHFIIAVILFFVNHYFAFAYFASTYYPLSEAMGYFTICLWLVPFALFVSLSANENVLPTVTESRNENVDDSVLGSYLSKRGKKYGLLSLFHYVNNHVFPQRNKKLF
uniref:Protein TEX261 n=2 Tax=Lygus hesperus TaxID=30085 RepID=A0A146L3D8_LYGHE